MSASRFGQREALPAFAAVGAAKGALGRADEDGIGILGMDRDRVHLGAVRQPVAQRVPALVPTRRRKMPPLPALRRPHRPGIHMATSPCSPPALGWRFTEGIIRLSSALSQSFADRLWCAPNFWEIDDERQSDTGAAPDRPQRAGGAGGRARLHVAVRHLRDERRRGGDRAVCTARSISASIFSTAPTCTAGARTRNCSAAR